MNQRPKISVIIPVYGVEKYIERCVRSLFGQTLDSIEYIFVDDCTPDRSMEIMREVLEEYPHRKDQVRCIRHERNGGLAMTRTTGMKAATGEYLISCDSDDWVERDMYEAMYYKAKAKDVDMVVCDVLCHHNNGKTEVIAMEDFAAPQDMLTCGYFIHLWSMCMRLVRTSIVQENKTYAEPNMDMWEDVCSAMMLCFYAKSIAFVHKGLYHYDRTREDGISTSVMSQGKVQSMIVNVRKATDCIAAEGFDMGVTGMIYKKYLRDNLLTFNPRPWKIWRETFPEVADYVDKDTQCSQLYKICYRLANKGFYWPLKMQMRMWEWRNR